jgi:hypothetical protein
MTSVWAWFESVTARPDLPAWLQAFAAVVALCISVWAVFRTGAAERRRDRLQSRAIAVAIYPEILKLEIVFREAQERLRRLAETWGGKAVGQTVAANIRGEEVAIPTMLARNIDRLFMLGEPAGASCLQLINVMLQYNDFVIEIGARSVLMNAEQWPQGVRHLLEHLALLDGIVAKCKREVAPLHDAIRS